MWNARIAQLGVAALAMGMLLVPRTAHAQHKRLEIFANYGGQIYHHWSDDAGKTWSAWLLVPPTVRYYGGALSFVGQPAVTSGAPGVIRIAAKTVDGVLVENVYFTRMVCERQVVVRLGRPGRLPDGLSRRHLG